MGAEPLDDYHDQVEKGIFSPLPYERLMIHYRKEKDFEAELKVIKKGIDTFKKFYAKLQGSAIKNQKRKIAELSRKISKSTGLIDKKGNDAYLPEPLPKWIKRQLAVEQKLKMKKS